MSISVPLESAPHIRTFMQWPSGPKIYRTRPTLHAVQKALAAIANAIVKFEPVVMLVTPQAVASARKHLSQHVEILVVPVDDAWCRDSGPTFVLNDGCPTIVNLNFNGWGNKQPHARDAKLPALVARHLELPFLESDLVGEAGGIEFDGEGTALAHKSSWLNPNRTKFTQKEIEALFRRTLGAQRIIWSPGLLGKDITDMHIDAVARFIRPGQVLVQLPREGQSSDAFAIASLETYSILKSARDAAGRRLEVIEILEPSYDRIRCDAPTFVASYANFYALNSAVVVPEFGDERADEDARSCLQKLYPGRQIISLNIDALGLVGGGIHCVTKQHPASQAE